MCTWVLLPGMSQGVCWGNDPESEVNSKPSVFVVIGVAVKRGAITTQDVLQTPVREVTPLWRGHHHKAIGSRIYPLIGRPAWSRDKDLSWNCTTRENIKSSNLVHLTGLKNIKPNPINKSPKTICLAHSKNAAENTTPKPTESFDSFLRCDMTLLARRLRPGCIRSSYLALVPTQ